MEDIDLVIKAKNKNNIALEKLILKYKPLILKYSGQFYRMYNHIPLEYQDIHSMLIVSFWKLINSYDIDSPKSFPSYIKQFLLWKGHEEFRKYTTNSMKVMNQASFLEPFNDFTYKDKEKINFSILEKYLSNVEYKVISLLSEGFKLNEISSHLDKNITNIYSIKNRAIIKAREANNKAELF